MVPLSGVAWGSSASSAQSAARILVAAQPRCEHSAPQDAPGRTPPRSERQERLAAYGRPDENFVLVIMPMPSIEIRNETPDDGAAIQEIHTRAFGGPTEAKLVQFISERKKALISLIAIRDGKVVGHILFSRVTIANAPAAFGSVGLAPVAVLPEFQRQGIGSQLIREGLATCRQAGYDAVVVLGDPAYYSRFGFIRAADFGLQNERSEE